MRSRLAGFWAALIAFVTAVSAVAEAQDYRDIGLGDRMSGEVFPLMLGAQNVNCQQPIDFRFISKSSWLRLPADPVVRQVPQAQTKTLQVTVDLSGAAPGPRIGFIDIDCENCGFLIFRNCKINRQTLRFNVNVIASAPPPGGGQPQQGPPQGGNGPQTGPADGASAVPPQIDYDDARIPKAKRRKAKAAFEDWQDKLKKKKPCEEELAKLRAAAAEARAAADKAKAEADAAAEEARKTKAEEEAANKEYQDASKAWNDTQKAVEDAQDRAKQPNRTTGERAEDKAAVEAAVAAAAAAKKRVEDAVKRRQAARAANARALEKAAGKAAAAAADAEGGAARAAAAVAEKEKECLKIESDIDDARGEAEKAAREAEASLPVVKYPTAEEIAKARKEANDCIKELGELIDAQAKALQALASLGALKKDPNTGEDRNTYDGDLAEWAKGVDAANDLFGKIPPEVKYAGPVGEAIEKYAGAAEAVLGAVRAAIGVWSGVKYTGKLNLAPKAGETKDPAATKQYLKDQGLAADDAEAGRILDQMEKYSESNSTKGMQQQLADKKAKCDGMVDDAEAKEQAAAGK